MVDSSYLLAVNSYFDIFLGLQNTYSSSWILWLLVVLPASMASLASLASMASPSSLPQFDGPPVGGGRQEAPRARQRWHKIGRCSFFAQLYSLPCKFPPIFSANGFTLASTLLHELLSSLPNANSEKRKLPIWKEARATS